MTKKNDGKHIAKEKLYEISNVKLGTGKQRTSRIKEAASLERVFFFDTGTRITKNKPQPSRISVRNVMLEK